MQENMEMRTGELEINLLELVMYCLRKWWVIAIFVVVAFFASLFYTISFVTPMYRASISIYVNNTKGAENLDNLSSADLSAAQRLVNTYISIAKSDRVLDKLAEALDGKYATEELKGIISAEQMNGTEIFYIHAVCDEPKEAARIANAAAMVAPVEISNLIEGTSARVIDSATVPTDRYSPSYSKAGIIGVIVGVALALTLLVLLFLQDTHIKSENDLTELFSVPILGRIPEFGENYTDRHPYDYKSNATVPTEEVEA